MTKLSNRESFLVSLTFVVVAVTIILSLCITLILPDHMTSKPKKYVSNMENKSEAELKHLCECSTVKSKTRIDCKPHRIPIKSIKKNLDCNADEWNFQKSYSYLVSLTDPAYIDDENERIFVCAGVIISNYYILCGWTCVAQKSDEELKDMRMRVGSNYWSKGGKEIHGLSISQDYRGLQILKMNTKLIFNDQVQALQLPIPGTAFPVSSAVTLNWESNKLHNSFQLKNWISYPCEHFDILGEIKNGVYFEEGAKSLVLVSETKMLIGFLGNIIVIDDQLTYLFADLQCDTYPSWLYYAIDIYGDGSFRPISTECHEDHSILIYQGEHCNDLGLTTSLDTSTVSMDDTSTITIDDTSITSIDDVTSGVQENNVNSHSIFSTKPTDL